MRERWPNERMSSTPNQRWLRRSSARLRPVMRGASLDREIGGVHHLRPFFRLAGEQLAEIRGRAGDRRAAELLEFGLHAGVLERLVDLLVEDIDDIGRRALRGNEAEEGARLIARHGF